MPKYNRFSPSPTKVLMLGSLAVAMLVAGGCTTKKYVRQQTEPLINHVNQLDTETAQNTNAIRTVNQNAQQGIAQAKSASSNALQTAQSVQGQAQQVGQQLNQTSGQIKALDSSLANIDDYSQVGQSTVHFGFDKSNLTSDAQATLDQVATQLQQNPHSIVEVEGFTDSTGPRAYNDKLSERRAQSVVRYLQSKNIAPHRMFLIGLGENEAVASNATVAGRKENRRVDLTIMANKLGGTAAANPDAGSQPSAQAGQ